MSDEEEDKLRTVLERWTAETPEDYEMTRLELREHPNEITVGSQTGMRKGNQYALTWEDVNFKLRLITLPDTKTGVPHTVPMTEDVYGALKDQQDIQTRMQELRGDKETRTMKLDDRVFTIRENREWLRRQNERQVSRSELASTEPTHRRFPTRCQQCEPASDSRSVGSRDARNERPVHPP